MGRSVAHKNFSMARVKLCQINYVCILGEFIFQYLPKVLGHLIVARGSEFDC